MSRHREPTEAELNALEAEQRANLPVWWSRSAKRDDAANGYPSGHVARTERRRSIRRMGRDKR